MVGRQLEWWTDVERVPAGVVVTHDAARNEVWAEVPDGYLRRLVAAAAERIGGGWDGSLVRIPVAKLAETPIALGARPPGGTTRT